jgi:hypothetical protein
MIPIVRHQNEDLNYSSFLNFLKASASDAYEKKQVYCNCLLLFDETHPEVVKLLRDREYYASLNSISGRWINIFHAGVRLGRKEGNLTLDHREAPYKEVISNLREEFLVNQNPKNPLVFFFYVKDNEIPEVVVYKISDGSYTEIYREVSSLIERMRDQICKIEKENYENYEVIFDLQKTCIESITTIRAVKNLRKIPIIGFLGMIKKFVFA